MDHYVLTKTLFVVLSLLITVKGSMEVAFENCGGTKFKMTDVRTSPNPFHSGDKVNFMMNIDISTTLGKISGEEIFEKYVNGKYEKLDCESTSAGILLGPCGAVDLCEKWKIHCPPLINAISPNSTCPIPEGKIHIHQSTISIPWNLKQGYYRLRYVMKKDGELIGCTQGNITATLKKNY